MIEIPNKSVFKIDEVCQLTGIKPYVLRFWEMEFEDISPITSSTGHKLYERKDIQIMYLIKKLIYEDKMTIERAKQYVKNNIENLPEIDIQILSDGSDFITPIVEDNSKENVIERKIPKASSSIRRTVSKLNKNITSNSQSKDNIKVKGSTKNLKVNFNNILIARDKLKDLIKKTQSIKDRYHIQ